MGEANVRRQFTEDVLAGRRAAAPALPETGSAADEIARPGVGHDYMLELRFKSGRSTFVDWSYFPQCDYDPEHGIRMKFSTCEVRIEGSNLRGLVDEICARKRRLIEENATASKLVKLVDAPTQPYVSKITVTDREEFGGNPEPNPVQR